MKRRRFAEVNFYTTDWPIDTDQDMSDGFYFAKDNWDDYGLEITSIKLRVRLIKAI